MGTRVRWLPGQLKGPPRACWSPKEFTVCSSRDVQVAEAVFPARLSHPALLTVPSFFPAFHTFVVQSRLCPCWGPAQEQPIAPACASQRSSGSRVGSTTFLSKDYVSPFFVESPLLGAAPCHVRAPFISWRWPLALPRERWQRDPPVPGGLTAHGSHSKRCFS